MGSDERDLEQLLLIKRKRLRVLERNIARLGYNAPPEMVNEFEDLKEEIAKDSTALEPVIDGTLSDDAMAALRAFGLSAAVKAAIQSLEARFWELKRDFVALQQSIAKALDKEGEAREKVAASLATSLEKEGEAREKVAASLATSLDKEGEAREKVAASLATSLEKEAASREKIAVSLAQAQEADRVDRNVRQADADTQRSQLSEQLVKINLYVRVTSVIVFLLALGVVIYFVLSIYFGTLGR